MKAMDLRKSHTVVIYESGKGWFASRAAFMFRAFGHPRVFVLDGGLGKWCKEGRPVEKDDVGAWDQEFAYNLDAGAFISYERMQETCQDGSVQIVECRPPPMVDQTGTYPNAIRIPTPGCLNEDGTVKSADQLREMFSSKGVDAAKPIAFSCGSGIMASMALACAEKAGIPSQMLLFDGSWAEWSAKQPKQ